MTDPYDDLARELRRGAGAEMREEAEITELETRQGRLRRRRLADVAAEAMHRGDRVTVEIRDRRLVGTAVFVGDDYLTLETATEVADVRLDRAVLWVARRPAGGHASRGGSRTLRARLGEYEHTGETVTVVAPAIPAETAGQISVAAVDHVLVSTTDGEVVVPLPLIELVVRPRPGPTR